MDRQQFRSVSNFGPCCFSSDQILQATVSEKMKPREMNGRSQDSLWYRFVPSFVCTSLVTVQGTLVNLNPTNVMGTAVSA